MVNSTVGNYLLDKLYSKGVNHIFGIPGDYILKFNQLIEQHEKIKFIGTTRENTAGYMADAYARNVGIGVACITYGVGINIVNAMAQAFVESVPLIILSGAAGTHEFIAHHNRHHLINTFTNQKHDLTQLEIFKHVSIAQTILDDPKSAAKEIDQIIDICLFHKKPVYIEIPRDIVDQPTTPHRSTPTQHQIRSKDTLDTAIELTSHILKTSTQPIIWVGHEVDRCNLSSYLLNFAEKFGIPICSSLLGKTAISERHPLYKGIYQGELSQENIKNYFDTCDCLISLGVILSDVDTGIFSAKFKQPHQIFANLNTLLIDKETFSNVSFSDYIQQLANLKPQKKLVINHSKEQTCSKFNSKKSTKITTKRAFECIEAHIQFGDYIVADIGDSLFGSSEFILDKGCFIACAYYATLGYGTPAAIATQLVHPEKRVIGIIGDGAFQMTCTELSTAIRYNINPIMIVLNNRGYGTERLLIEGSYNDVLDWNYSALTQVFKEGIGIEVKTECQLEEALIRALNDPSHLYIIEIKLDKTDFSPNLTRFAELVNQPGAHRP